MNTETFFYKILKNIISIGLSDFINKGVLFLFNVVVARYLAVKEYGLFSLSISVGIYLWSVADGGVTAHATKMAAQFGRQNLNNIISFAVPTRLGLSLLVTLALGIGLNFFRVSFYESLVYLSAILYLIAMSLFSAWIMRGLQDNFGYFVIYIFLSLFVVFFLVFWLRTNVVPKNALSAIFFRNFGYFIGALFGLFWAIRRLKLKINIQDLHCDFEIVKTTYPLCVAAIFYSLIPLIPQLALRFYGSLEELGNYGAIWQFQRLLLGGALVFSSSFMPMIAKVLYCKNIKSLKKVLFVNFSFLILTVLFLAICYNVYGVTILYKFYGTSFMISRKIVFLFSLVLILYFVRLSVDAILIGLNKYKSMSITGLLTITIISSLFFLSDKVDILKASFFYLLGEAIILFLNLGVVTPILLEKFKGVANE